MVQVDHADQLVWMIDNMNRYLDERCTRTTLVAWLDPMDNFVNVINEITYKVLRLSITSSPAAQRATAVTSASRLRSLISPTPFRTQTIGTSWPMLTRQRLLVLS
jgi:hypothetical protein